MKKPFLPCLVLLLASAQAQASASSVGTAAVPFLVMPAGARAVGMGGTGAAAAEDATAILWNPALLARAKTSSASLMHSAYLQSSMYNFAALNWKIAQNHALGLSVQYFSAGEINSTDDAGQDLGALRPYDIAFSGGYAFVFQGWSAGASAKFIQSKIISTGKAYAADLGVSPPELLNGRLRLGASVSNIGGKIRYDSTDEKLPSVVRAGFGFKPLTLITFAGDISMPNAGKAYLSGGAECGLQVTSEIQAALRAGYSTQPDTDGFSGATAGVGFRTRDYALDYAFAPFGALGNTHRFSLTFYWGYPKPSGRPARFKKNTDSLIGDKIPQPQSPSPAKRKRYVPPRAIMP